MSGLMPNFGRVQARYGAESERPNLWTGLQALWTPPVTPTGLTWRDQSMHHNHGTLTNMNLASDWVQSPYGWALDFDGGDDVIVIADAPSLDVAAVTIAAWINPDTSLDASYIVAKLEDWAVGGQASYALSYVSGYLKLFISENGFLPTPEMTSSAVVTAGTWQFIVATYSAGVYAIYLDGVAQATNGAGNATGNIYSGTGRLAIGARYDSSAGNYRFFLNGQIASVGIWSRALASSEIADFYADSDAMLRRWEMVIPLAVNRRRRVLIGAV